MHLKAAGQNLWRTWDEFILQHSFAHISNLSLFWWKINAQRKISWIPAVWVWNNFKINIRIQVLTHFPWCWNFFWCTAAEFNGSSSELSPTEPWFLLDVISRFVQHVGSTLTFVPCSSSSSSSSKQQHLSLQTEQQTGRKSSITHRFLRFFYLLHL